jgi:hypothetical protein
MLDEETKRSIDGINQKLETLQAADKEHAQFRKQHDDQRRQIKAELLGGATFQPGWAQLKLLSGRDPSSKNPDDYDIVFGSEMGSPTAERWKLDVNERYQKAVGTVITLSTAALGSPIVFLKDIHAKRSILDVLTFSAYMGGILLAISIVCAVVYYFFSAKWVKLALVNQADFFWIPIGKDFVESILDVTYFLMMIGFLAGVYFMLQFMATYVSPAT